MSAAFAISPPRASSSRTRWPLPVPPMAGLQGMLIAVCGIVCSIIGSFFVKTKEDATQMSLLKSLRTGTYLAAVLSAIAAAPLTYYTVGNWGVYVAILCGLVGGCAIGYFTEYYTSDTYKPTQDLAASSETGSATVIIGGLSLGMAADFSAMLREWVLVKWDL